MNRHSWPASPTTARIGRILRAGDVVVALEEILDDIKREIAAVSGGADLHQGIRLLQVIQNLYEPAPLRPVW
jgi:hypothetical protein